MSNAKGHILDIATDTNELQILANNIPIPCWIASANGAIFWFNRKWHEYCGSTPFKMASGGWKSVHDQDELPATLAMWELSFAVGEAFEATMRLKGSDGVFRSFLTKVEPARDKNGQIIRWIGIHTDITAQLEAEEKLRSINYAMQNLTSYRQAVLAQLAEGIIITDAGGRILFVNKAAKDLHGVMKLDIEPQNYAESYSLFTVDREPHPSETLPLTRAVLKEETVIDARWLIRRPDGSEVLALGNAQPVYSDSGQKIGAVLTIHDDTARHASELALAEAAKAKEALLYEVNHRVKNSLQIVTSLLMLQSLSSNSAELKQSLKEACARVDIVAGLHHRLYSDGGHSIIMLGSYIRDFTMATVNAFSTAGEIDVQFSQLEDVELDMDQAVPIALIIGELLTNSIKYAFDNQAEKRIVLAVSSNQDDVNIMVCDNGKGLPVDFERTASNGFGMKIVTALLPQISGSFTQLKQDQGAGFLISFPKC